MNVDHKSLVNDWNGLVAVKIVRFTFTCVLTCRALIVKSESVSRRKIEWRLKN